MKIGLQSRFCENCQKNVIDFTKKSREEILAYLLENQHQGVCGRVHRSQLDYSNTDFLVTINALSKRHKNSNFSFYLLAMSALMIAGCGENQVGKVSSSELSIADIEHVIPTVIDKDVEIEEKIVEKDLKINTTLDTRFEYAIPEGTFMEWLPKEQWATMGFVAVTPSTETLVYEVLGLSDAPSLIHNNHEPYRFVEKMPEFPSGIDNLMGYVKNNLQYPEWELDKRIEGTVVASYVIDREGKISDVEIIKSVDGSKNFDKEVIRIVKSMPNWTPGEQDGKKVAVQFTLPVRFKI